MRLAIDVSNYSGPIMVEQARCLRQQGVEHVIAGTQVPSVTRAQLEAALAVGMSIDVYVYLYWRRDVAAEVREALRALEGLPVGCLWLDCEDSTAGLSPAEVVDLIERAHEACGPQPAGIYTGRWWWPNATAGSAAFSHLPLWHAEYTRSIDDHPDFGTFTPYGGWTRPRMWQYRGTTVLCGVSLDLNLSDTPAQATPERRDSLELGLLRSSQRFDRARALGRFIFRPVPHDPASIELQRLEGGRAQSFEPPYVLRVD